MSDETKREKTPTELAIERAATPVPARVWMPGKPAPKWQHFHTKAAEYTAVNGVSCKNLEPVALSNIVRDKKRHGYVRHTQETVDGGWSFPSKLIRDLDKQNIDWLCVYSVAEHRAYFVDLADFIELAEHDETDALHLELSEWAVAQFNKWGDFAIQQFLYEKGRMDG